MKIENYYLAKNAYPERVTEPQHIEEVYWTDAFGLTAYKNKAGELWTIESKCR